VSAAPGSDARAKLEQELAKAAEALPNARAPMAALPPRIDPASLRTPVEDATTPKMRVGSEGVVGSMAACLALPFRGAGPLWLLLYASLVVGAVVLMIVFAGLSGIPSRAVRFLGFVARIGGIVGLIASFSVLYQLVTAAFVASLLGDRAMTFEHRVTVLWGDGAVLLGAAMVLMLPVQTAGVLFDGGLALLLRGALALLPALLWPALLWVAVRTQNVDRIIEVPEVRRIWALAPRQYLAIVGSVWSALALGLVAWAALSALLPAGALGKAVAAVVAVAPIAYAHAVMGALFGKLLHEVPEVGHPEIAFIESDGERVVAGIPTRG
jgi:hypothetical protein